MRKQNNRCVYTHRRTDTNKVFYIGMGTSKRAYEKLKRNLHWKRIISKTNFEVEIVYDNLSWEDACELEVFLISEYGRESLCNMTDGGDGSLGTSPSEETREKIRAFHKGKPKSEESKIKMSIAKEGMYLLDSNPRARKVININTNEIFNTLKEASINEGIKYGTFKWAINHKLNFNYKYYG